MAGLLLVAFGTSLPVRCNTDVYLMTAELAPDANPPTRVPAPQQQEMPLAVVHGQPVLQIPQDLYIPPG